MKNIRFSIVENNLAQSMVISFLLFSCGDRQTTNVSDESGVSSVSDNAFIIDISTMRALAARDDVLLVDNRPHGKFRNGHLRGAVNMPFFARGAAENEMSKEKLAQAAAGKNQIVFYCSGHMRAGNALNLAKEWQLPQKMYWYKNGYAEWVEQGHPVVQP